MKSKEKILNAALLLYNEQGIRNITTRHIAASIGMSGGNLHYHFKHTEDIIRALFDELALAYDGLMANAQSVPLDLSAIAFLTESSFKLVNKYRFIFINFVEIGNWIPEIRDAYYQLIRKREQQFLKVFENLIANGIFRDDIPTSNKSGLVKQFFIINDFWLSHNELTDQHVGEDALNEYQNAIDVLLWPYLKRHQ
ncbi:TetR/AcrR family transcriptional regulator [Pedobacter chitinilyticus]|uniref:TetR/AcrR family transcriptional regulator n=1 Tax=Pedobacter chitinilyticus TaxID=2233776 RepID=A0A3S3QE60_9SPHI|nr:TetR/AcrR family transcriptional regulator [Pedobacter chitinilyticus]RWU04808.1 TetR/AcrR family transcriptional regulator [Pedobacter chitinilyticus]